MTETPDPFNPQPTEPQKSGSGCSRPLLIGCGVLLVLLGVGALILALNAGKLATWAFDKFEEQIQAQLPDDIPAADRQRLGQAFDHLGESIQDGTADPTKLRLAQTKMRDMALDTSKITVEDVRELAALLEDAAGRPPVEDADGGPPGG